MSAFLAPMFGAGYQAFNNTGSSVLSGGKLYTYQAGSTTAQATWTDSTQSVANANPIILNSAGRPDNEIWLQGGSTYKFVLKDSTGVQLGAWDNVAGLNDASYQGFSEWIPFGTSPTYVSSTSFTVAGNQTSLLTAGRRVQFFGLSYTGYASIASSTYSSGSGTTTVNLINDSTTVDSTLYAFSYGFLSSVNPSVPTVTNTVTSYQLQNQTYTGFTSAGTAPAYTLSASPALTLSSGARVRVKWHAATTSGAVTFAPNGLTAKSLKTRDFAGNLANPVLQAGQLSDIEYDGTEWIILNPALPQFAYPTVTAGVMYADSSGILTTGSALTFDGTNLGLGVTPSAWNASWKALQVGANSALANQGSVTDLQYNVYRNTSNVDTYISADFATRYRQISGTHAWFTAASGTASNPITFTQAMTLDVSGNHLVGKTALDITTVGAQLRATGQITSTLAGTTAATDTLNVYSSGAAAYRFYVDMSGTVHATSIVISAISDQRLKENVRDIDTGLSAIMALKPRRFDWKEGKGQDKKNASGFIAQEFEEVFPECVGTSKAGDDGIEYKNINHETLIPTLVKAIQELKAEFDSYKATHP